MAQNRMEFVEYVGDKPDFSFRYGGYTYTFTPNPMFGGKRVEFIKLGFALNMCFGQTDMKPYLLPSAEQAEAEFKAYVLSRKEEIMEWLTEPEAKVPAPKITQRRML